MKAQLTVALCVNREEFIMEKFIGSDDIFALVKEGSFSMEREGTCFIVQKNEGALFRKNVLYQRHVISPVTMYLFRYKSDIPVFDTDHIIFHNQERLASTLSMLERLDTEVFGNDFEYRSHLFSDLAMQYAMENKAPESSDDPIEHAMDEIRQSLHVGVDLEKLGKKSGLSYVQFLRRFKSIAGMTPSDYIIALRLQKAKTLLADTDLLIKDVSSACGFENEYYFSNFFKKHTSLSPSAFRSASRS
ncbi:MAG: helix-turn-helix transcriptional regulator [Ruminococcaceae bacterium]|nr:helix-turn-helix transcriptional regulator [Oscillospiraceae bacterium]